MNMIKHSAALIAAFFAMAPSAFAETAAQFPTKQIHLVVPYPPSGGNDTLARAIGEKLGDILKTQVIVDNKAGANGLIACEFVAKADGDGYTLLMANVGSHGINPALYKKLPYDPIDDFVPVSQVATSPNVLVATPGLHINDVAALIDYARQHPGKITYGSNGAGSSPHLSGAWLGSSYGLQLLHVPYRGTGPMMTDLLGGQIDMGFASLPAVSPFFASGQLKPLAVTTPKRSSLLPNVPALAETIPGFNATVWWAIVASKGTPMPIAEKLSAAIREVLKSPEVKAQMVNAGADPQGSTPAELAALIKSELTKWVKVVRDTGATVE